MSRPPLARERVLAAFEEVINTEGERAATMERVASVAGVSKGGLLYHFASKIALEEGLIERMIELVELDMKQVMSDPEGPVAAFMRSSAETGTDVDNAITAVGRLASVGSVAAADAMTRMRDIWATNLAPFAANDVALQLILLVSDGIYFNSALTVGAVPAITDMDALVAMVTSATAPGSLK